MFAPFLTRIAEKCNCWPQRPGSSNSLRPDHFPMEARGRDIVAQNGVVLATVTDAAIGRELVIRLNATYWSSLEDQWAL
jgi:hypothetical protein